MTMNRFPWLFSALCALSAASLSACGEEDTSAPDDSASSGGAGGASDGTGGRGEGESGGSSETGGGSSETGGGGGRGGSDPSADGMTIEGSAEKGPFIQGSTVTVSVLDAALAPTGQNFPSEIASDAGDFELLVPTLAPIRVEAEGFYYSEKGSLSVAPITLRALYVPEVSGTQTVYVNLVTHLTAKRIERLVQDGESFADAVAQAEEELRSSLLITTPGFAPSGRGTELTMVGTADPDGAAYLFGLSAVLAYHGGDDAGLQALLNTLSSDLEEEGVIPSADVEAIQETLLTLDTATVEADFDAYLDEIESGATAPDLDLVLDQDLDGLVNADDNCPRAANASQADGDGDGAGDACDPCPETDCAEPGDCVPDDFEEPSTGTCADRCELGHDGSGDDCGEGLSCTPGLSWASGASTGVDLCTSECDLSGSGELCPADMTCVQTISNQFLCRPVSNEASDGDEGDMCVPTVGGCLPGLVCILLGGALDSETCGRPCTDPGSGSSDDCDGSACEVNDVNPTLGWCVP